MSLTHSINISAHLRVVVLMTLSFLVSTPSQAEVRPQGFELSLYGGYWQGGRVVDDASYFGVSAGYQISRIFTLEFDQNFINTQGVVDGTDVTSASPREDIFLQQGMFNILINLSPNRLTPYINFGAGWVGVGDEVYGLANLGLGTRYYFTDDLALRFGIKMFMGDLYLRKEPYEHFTAYLGITYSFSGDRDLDKDGLRNPDDQCPTIAEDPDDFQDNDGCPDKDNDEDGVPDDKDQCPEEPYKSLEEIEQDKKNKKKGSKKKDKEKTQEEITGCPNLDQDKDGINDKEDQCPNDPEDIDQHKDDDGCPDPDNDGDKILDKVDKCPNSAETVNGFQDDDGCPEGDKDGDGLLDGQDQKQ